MFARQYPQRNLPRTTTKTKLPIQSVFCLIHAEVLLDSSLPIIVASSLVLVLYLLDMLSGRWKIPSVLFLVASGVLVRVALQASDIAIPESAEGLLPTLGLIGLALVVLEGSLELRWRPGQGVLLGRSTLSALLGIVVFDLVMAVILRWTDDLSWRVALLNALPLAIISSAIAIPSAAALGERDRDFVALESSTSDILGVLAFNALVLPIPLGLATLWNLSLYATLTVILSAIIALTLLWLLGQTTHKVKFVPLLAALLLCFSLGKFFHLSSLVLLLVFGLYLANISLLPHGGMRSLLVYAHFPADLHLLETIVKETTFLARTFFFFLFGFTLHLSDLLDAWSWFWGLSALGAIYLSRWGVLRLCLGRAPRSLLFLAPRGLITILLATGIAADEQARILAPGALLIVILGTSFLQILAGRKVAEMAGVVPPFLEPTRLRRIEITGSRHLVDRDAPPPTDRRFQQ